MYSDPRNRTYNLVNLSPSWQEVAWICSSLDLKFRSYMVNNFYGSLGKVVSCRSGR